MRRAFTGSSGAIMASETTAGSSGMIEPGAGPSDRSMAGVTLIGALNVAGIFPHGGNIVVTTGAGSHHRTMVNPENGRPGLSRVAVGAEVVRPNMIRTFWRRPHQSTPHMTGETPARRAPEGPAHMAAFATSLKMGSG